jgi:hypothetical protein
MEKNAGSIKRQQKNNENFVLNILFYNFLFPNMQVGYVIKMTAKKERSRFSVVN